MTDSGLLLHDRNWRDIEIIWSAIIRVDVWQVDMWIHVIGMDIWADNIDRRIQVSEREREYAAVVLAVRQNLRPFDSKEWDYVHADFFADISRTVYRRA